MSDNETWKRIPHRGTDDHYYEVSDLGRVRSIRILSQTPIRRQSGNGTSLTIRSLGGRGFGKKTKSAYIHRLVAEAFCERPDGADTVHHRDGNHHNNAASNLEWLQKSDHDGHHRRLNTNFAVHAAAHRMVDDGMTLTEICRALRKTPPNILRILGAHRPTNTEAAKKRRRNTFPCAYCGKPTYRPPAQRAVVRNIYCSRACYGMARRKPHCRTTP